ncbi:transcriptional regulator, LysR family [Variovorax sp. PDC80]|uniref:LysR family transcriptional regulator n=1 Tax=Variovorax sp. PDC80 TaxID=1882827 RepID=UPI0008ED64A1|nr:LysR family transcriptional regulator [Variovorax sp. PDC80]SFO79678.1 transcriptional regulator, LysR family [Variovorax sp. PDC80]
MDWSDVKIFLAVARAGSLGGAARLTGQSQPTMGRRLRVLEREVGQALFQRGKDGFVLTDEGASVLAHSERMEEEALAFERRLAGQAQQLEGQLRVSSSDWFGVHILTPVFAEFVQQHPLVNIELITDARLFSLARREADLVFRIQPFDEADVVQRKAVHVAYRVYRAKGTAHPVRSDGQGVPLITLDSAFQDFPDAAWLRKKLPKARVAFGSNSREAQARMCAAGVGLAVLPAPLGDACTALEVVDLGGLPPGRDVWVGFHRDLRRLGRLRALVDATVERLSAG